MEKNIFLKNLTNGQSVALSALEVVSVPHCSIIADKEPAEIIEEYKKAMSDLLSEIYQIYYSLSISENALQDISLELLWTTSAVKNQPYDAGIRFFVIARTINSDSEKAENCADTIINTLDRELKLQKYETTFIGESEINDISQKLVNKDIKAIVKQESADDLQNTLMRYCFEYDKLPDNSDDFSRLISALTEYPDCAVSFQLIPTMYTPTESGALATNLQNLETLAKGVMDSGNMVSVAAAEKHTETYRYYTEHKSGSLFMYNILIYAQKHALSAISGRVHVQLSNNITESANLKLIDIKADEIDEEKQFYPLPWAVNELLMYKYRDSQFWQMFEFPIDAFYRLPYIITNEEAAEFFRLPVGSKKVSAGINVNESGKASKSYADNIINSGDISVGVLRSSIKSDTIGFSLGDLAKHMLITGTPGSGKTTFSVGLLDRLWKDHHIPFLVIEPAKNEYRALVQSIPELQVFTPGKNFISPFIYNPFIPPKNVKLEAYKSTLKTAFAAGMTMQAPLDSIFEETVNNCYSDFRWIDTYTADDGGKTFNIHDFIKVFNKTFDDIGYTGDAKNIGRAGTVRLNSLINLFDSYSSIPIEDLLTKPTVIELSAIENNNQKALIIALLLLSILSYVNANYVGEGGLKNVILLEEAHVLLDSENASSETANPSAVAQGLVKRMLAEIRSYGVSLIIADQSPRKVTTDVVALTDMKLTFRLVESSDKEIIANSTNMTDVQTQRLSRLRPGEAFFFFNKLVDPEEVITENYRLENKISISLSDDAIASLSTYWKVNEDKLRPYPECLEIKHCERTCDFERRTLARDIARRIYAQNFKENSTDFEVVKKVFAHISSLITAELNHEPFTPELLSCVKVHLWRRIKYNTKIKISDKLISNSLKK